ncbi:hypothetical protein FSP39_003183 [Pinctada imbricata]|uniref:DNA-directed DNA polymerase n=1 Tax=Pinctada imbricata TaxID=66713 RepID=A0AA89CBU3_PINIB|nr:hypothetical protein FSP39_003183 [Pinctada imbricata]
MEIGNLGEYHDLYLKTDVLLLADCFEQFRDMCMKHYKLDPCHFYTSPGLAWAAALKMTKCKLDLLTDPDMYLFFERGIRGGISVVSNKYAKANNEHTPNYNPKQPKSFIHYVDANNLYGWSMRKALPEKNFRWMTPDEIGKFDVSKISSSSRKGYALEVDLEYPHELHDEHNCYPLAPETMSIPNEDLSPYSKKLWIHQNKEGGVDDEQSIDGDRDVLSKRIVTPKLIPNLHDKKNYTMKSNFKRFSIFNEDLVGVEHKKINLKLNKPIYVGFTTLELSKTLLFRFHYLYMRQKYGDKARLLFTDTDSLMYHIETEDLYKDMAESKDLFDLSNFAEDHFLHDKTNMTIPGYFKDETEGMAIFEFCGLRSKMYSFTYGENEKRTAKGISQNTVKKHLKHAHYKRCLFDGDIFMCGMHAIRSSNHELYVQRINKSGLSAFDDKRWVRNDGITTYAHGHYRAKDITVNIS